MPKVFEEISEATSKWKLIGLKLGVKIAELDAIESLGTKVEDKLVTMLEKWLQRGDNVTWKALAEAMGALTVGREDLKQNLLVKYC